MKLYALKHDNTRQDLAVQVTGELHERSWLPTEVRVVFNANDWKSNIDEPDGFLLAHKGDWVVCHDKSVRVVSDKYFKRNWLWKTPAAMKTLAAIA